MKISTMLTLAILLIGTGCATKIDCDAKEAWRAINEWGPLGVPCEASGVPSDYYQRGAFYTIKAELYFKEKYPDSTNSEFTALVVIPAGRNRTIADRNFVLVNYERRLPRTWQSIGVPSDTIDIVMNLHGAFLNTSRRGGYTRNDPIEDRNIIRDRFIQAGVTNYWHWGLDVDDRGQYALFLYGYPLRDFSCLSGLPIRRLDVCVSWYPLDLSALSNMPLQYLQLHKTRPFVLTPLARSSLRGIELRGHDPADIAPLTNCPLEVFSETGCIIPKQIELLRQMKTLKEIDRMPADKFWQEFDGRKKKTDSKK